MKYIVSQWGAGLSVGMIGKPEEVERDKNLAHNIFGVKYYDDVFNGRMNFNCIFKFYKFLIYKHALPFMNEHRCSLRSAIARTRSEIKKHAVVKNNFMFDLSRLPVQYKMGSYNDGDYGYEYED